MISSIAPFDLQTTGRGWHGLRKQIGLWAKIYRHVRAPLEKFQVPQHQFNHIGPLPPSNGYNHLLTIIDPFTKWPEAIPLKDTTTSSCIQALVTSWISCFGILMDMSSERGSQHFRSLGSNGQASGFLSTSHYFLSPSRERASREVSPSLEIYPPSHS